MPRQTRVLSEINSYAIIFKAEKEVVFNDFFKDYFLSLVTNGKADSYEFLGYVLQEKVFYIVISDLKVDLDYFLRKITVSFAKKYNGVFKRKGKVFADRAVCIPAKEKDDIIKMLTSLYKIGKVTNAKFNSFKNLSTNKCVDNNFLLSKFGNKHNFEKHITKNSPEKSVLPIKLSDEELLSFIGNELKKEPQKLVDLNQSELSDLVKTIFEVTSASARQIFRITGIPLKFLWKTYKKLSEKKVEET